MDSMTRKNRINSARKRLNGCCKSLVEIGQEEEPFLEFTHRSFPEFLQSRRTKGDMDYHLEGFNLEDAISQVILAKICFTELGSMSKSDLGRIAYSLLHMRDKRKVDQAPYSFLECLSSAVVHHGGSDLDEDDDVFDVGFPNALISGWTIIGSTGRREASIYNVSSCLYFSACLGNYEYVTWKVERDSTAIDRPLKMVLLLYCTMEFHSSPNHSLSILNLLLERGLSPRHPQTYG